MPAKTRYYILNKISLSLLLLIAVSVIASLIYSYSRFRTTLVQTTREAESYPYPTVSFCPGFHNHRRGDFPWLIPKTSSDRNRTVENFPATRTLAEQLWKETTYDLKEFLSDIDITFSNETALTFKSPDDLHCLTTDTLDTMFGRCYSMTLNCSHQFDIVYWNLIFDLGAINRSAMSLHFHDRKEAAIFGLNMNFWLLSSSNKPIVINSAVDIAIQRWVKSWSSGMDLEDYLTCEQETFSKSLNFRKLCWAPMFESCLAYATLGMDYIFDTCPDYYHFTLAYVELTSAMNSLSVQGSHRCTRPKTEVTYATKPKESEAPILGFTDKDGLAFACIYYNNDQVYLEEEYVLIDLGTLMSSIGGIVGAILGWSLLDAIDFCLKSLFA